MDARARAAVLTVAALLAVGVVWWTLGPRATSPDPEPAAATVAPVPASDRGATATATEEAPEPTPDDGAEAARRAEERPQHLGPIPGLAGRDGTDPEVRRELLDRIEEMEAERLGPEVAAERRKAREQQLDRRIDETLGP